MKTYSVTRTGENRTVNQDSFLCEEHAVGNLDNLFIVADGMGGYNGGDFASRFTVENIKSRISETSDGKSTISTMKEAIGFANEELRKKVSENPELKGCGTTAVLSTIKDHILYIANIGDSRLYVLHEGRLTQITEDHSLVEEMVKKGHIRREDARFHPDKHIVTRAIGSEPMTEPDFFEIRPEKGDLILMCSDGLSNMMDESFLRDKLDSGRELAMIGEELVKIAKDNGGKDDITIVMIEV